MPGCAAFSSKARRAAAAGLALLLAAHAPAADLADRLRLLQREDARVAAIFFRLAMAAAPFCRRRAPQSGLLLHRLAQYGPGARADAARLFGLGRRVAVSAVAPGSPAARAGLLPGDAIEAVDGVPLPDAAGAIPAIDAALGRGDATLRIASGGAARDVRIVSPAGCAARVQLVVSPRLNAAGNADTVSVTTAIVEFATSDDELAFLLGHELGHVARGGDPDESAADRLGLRIAAAAGFDPRAAAGIIVRLARARGQAGYLDPHHPEVGRRAAALRALAEP